MVWWPLSCGGADVWRTACLCHHSAFTRLRMTVPEVGRAEQLQEEQHTVELLVGVGVGCKGGQHRPPHRFCIRYQSRSPQGRLLMMSRWSLLLAKKLAIHAERLPWQPAGTPLVQITGLLEQWLTCYRLHRGGPVWFFYKMDNREAFHK